nr:alpha/beta fold hydrolase [Neisseria gonorrhoeae]
MSEIHQIYWEESGNPDGVPVIFLHGGPGAGASPECRGFFNPDVFRIVIIDQRGCGRSHPYACAEDNTTWDLVADIEKVREMLGYREMAGVRRFVGQHFVAGLCPNPSRTGKGLVLRGIFLCRPSETAWLNEAGGGEPDLSGTMAKICRADC